MFIERFYNDVDGAISFTRQQSSDFAKQVADDFNPLHDVDAKRFCVPGDLLFSVTLAKAGISQKMAFNFSGMVANEVALTFPEKISDKTAIVDANNKEYLQVSAKGNKSNNSELIESLITAYVGFSGHTFPHILVDLMAKNQVMINPARPMVMYESMSLELDDLSVEKIELKLSNSTLNIDGKRGNAVLAFNLYSGDSIVGRGEKHMLLSGLRPYCAETIANITEQYLASKADYVNAA